MIMIMATAPVTGSQSKSNSGRAAHGVICTAATAAGRITIVPLASTPHGFPCLNDEGTREGGRPLCECPTSGIRIIRLLRQGAALLGGCPLNCLLNRLRLREARIMAVGLPHTGSA